MAYYPHNLHFLWFAATADGRSKLAIDAARKTASRVDDETLKAVPLLAGFRVVPYFALTRFGKWDEMLREPEPPATSAYMRGTWHYARGTAFLGKGQTDEAEDELKKLNEIMADKSLDSPLFSPNTGRAILSIAQEVLDGRDCSRQRRITTHAIGAPRKSGATGRRAGLHRAFRVSLSAAAFARRDLVGGESAGRS